MQAKDKCVFPKKSDVVIKMFTDKDYFLAKYKSLGAENIKLLEHSHNGDEFSIKISRDVPAEVPLPGFLQKLVSGNLTAIQQDSWNAKTKKGRLDIQIKGVPGTITCEMELKDEGNGCANHMIWNAKVNMPLVGGKVEKVLLDDILGKAAADTAAGVQLLEKYS